MISATKGLECIKAQNYDSGVPELPQNKTDEKKSKGRPDCIDKNVETVFIDFPVFARNILFKYQMVSESLNWCHPTSPSCFQWTLDL